MKAVQPCWLKADMSETTYRAGTLSGTPPPEARNWFRLELYPEHRHRKPGTGLGWNSIRNTATGSQELV